MENLKIARAAKGYTQDKLSKLIGVSRSTVAMWETGDSQPDNKTLVVLANILNVSTDYLLGRGTNRKEGPQAAPLGDMEITLLNRFSSLPEAVKQHVLEYLDLLTNGTLVAGGAQLSEEQKAEILNSRNVETDTDHNSNSHKDAG